MPSPAVDQCLFPPELVARVGAVLDRAKHSGERVAALEEVNAMLVAGKVAWQTRMPPDFVGVHPLNRSRLGVGGSEAHVLGSEILQCGWSWRKAADATAVETPPSPWDAEAAESNARLVDLSGGLIPPLQQLKLLSVGGGHTNTFLRAVKAGVPTPVEKIADETGRLNAAKLSVDRPAFADALADGLKWLVYHWQVPFVWPELIPLVQVALNTSARGVQSEVEVMLQLHQAALESAKRGETPDWTRMKKEACFSMPPCASYIDVVASFVKANAGGESGELLQELSRFVKAFGCNSEGSARALGSEFLWKLTSLNFGPGQKFPLVQNACIEANLSAPRGRVIDGVCKLILPTHLATLTAPAQRKAVEEAEASMRDARALCESLKVEDSVRTRLVGQLDARLVLHILGRAKESSEAKVYPSLAAINQVFVKDLSSKIGRDVELGAAAAGASGSAADKPTPADMGLETVEQMHDKGTQAQKLGFKVGCYIVRKKKEDDQAEPLPHKVTSYGETGIMAEPMGSEEVSIPFDKLFNDWKVFKGKVLEKIENPEVADPLRSVSWSLEAIKGAIVVAIRQVTEQHASSANLIELFTPNMVKAAAPIKANALVLVAASQRIDRKASSGAIGLGSFALADSSEVRFYIAPQIVLPPSKSAWLAPFWMVQQAKKPEEANVRLEWIDLQVGNLLVKVPTLFNPKAVKTGAELKWFRDAPHPEPTSKGAKRKLAQ